LLSELDRREKEAGIFPEPEVDLFMKVATDHHTNRLSFGPSTFTYALMFIWIILDSGCCTGKC